MAAPRLGSMAGTGVTGDADTGATDTGATDTGVIEDLRRRRVRSFAQRTGRTTRGQARALTRLMPRFGVTPGEAPCDWPRMFPDLPHDAPLVLEVGFGMGEALVAMAAVEPNTRFVGVEVYDAGVGALLSALDAQAVTNVRVLHADIDTVLERAFPPTSLARIQIFFPDPWPKKRHHKRRLIQPAFLARCVDRLRSAGELHLATDWADYALHMREVCAAEPRLRNVFGQGAWAPGRGRRPATKFERRGRARGHAVYDLVYRRESAGAVG